MILSKTTDFTELIPEYLSNELDPETCRAFEAALTEKADLKRALEEFVILQDLYRTASPKSQEPSEAIFNKIIDHIDAAEEKTTGYRKHYHQPSWSTKIMEGFSWFKESFRLSWGVAAVQMAIIVLLLFPGMPEKTYTTLGITPETNTTNNTITLNIVFDDSARAADIKELLSAVDATIIAGPSPNGRYRIVIPKNKDSSLTISSLDQSKLTSFVEKAF